MSLLSIDVCRMYFDFSMTYIGAGIICPHIVNVSVLLGAIVSWGLMWPLISNHEGDWYPAGLGASNFRGLYGYKVPSTSSVTLSKMKASVVKNTLTDIAIVDGLCLIRPLSTTDIRLIFMILPSGLHRHRRHFG